MTATPTDTPTPTSLGPRAAVHLLNRLGFGPRPGDVERVLDRGLERRVLDQLRPTADPDVESRLRGFTTLGYSITQVLAHYEADRNSLSRVWEELFAAKVIRAVYSDNQLEEVLVDFWFNHLNVYLQDGFNRYATAAYERDAIRPHVLGKFRDLLRATAFHPAMMHYLDNYLSTVSRVDPRTGRLLHGLNENYGRELLELHTVGVDAGYSQEDVFEAARAFTGWGIDSLRTGRFQFRLGAHDTGAKRVFGLNLPAGGGQDDGETLLDYLATHAATARHVSFRLCQRFVADDPPESIVGRCAQVFRSTGGDISEVLKALVGSPEFWTQAFSPGKPKTPFEFTVSVLRAADAQITTLRGISPYLTNMGMPLYSCLPPTGYSNRGDDWLNPSSHLQRMNFALEVAANQISGLNTDANAVVRNAGGTPDDPASAANAVNRAIFGGGLTPETLDAASRVAPGGPVRVAARVLGLCLAGPDMQVR